MSDRDLLVLDSATLLRPEHRGRVAVAGSHGGLYPGWLAAKAGLRGVILCDAGVGKDAAGIEGLGYLDESGIPAAALGHRSARIADGEDQLRRGIVSHVNERAAALGCAPGQFCRACAEHLAGAAGGGSPARPYAEARHRLRAEPGEPEVWGLDSAALMAPEDRGRIIVTGSHGALLGGRSGDGLVKGPPLAAVFSDAGVGIDEAGIARLPALDGLGIAAVTVDVMTARIGDARSAWRDGRISHANETAARLGVRRGDGLPRFAAAASGARRGA